MIDGGEFGAIFTQDGVSIPFAADYQKTIDTRWRFLDIHLEFSYDITYSQIGSGWWAQKISDHDLGFIPGFTHRLTFDGALDSNGHYVPGNVDIVATKNGLYARGLMSAFGSPTPVHQRGFIRIFDCDILKTYRAPTEVAVYGADTGRSFGIKMLINPSVDLSDQDSKNFSINTEYKSLGIHQTGSFITNDNGAGAGKFSVFHGVGYPPTFLIAHWETPADWEKVNHTTSVVPDDYTYSLGPSGIFAGGGSALIKANSVTLDVTSTANTKYGVVILKEPAEFSV